MATFVVALHTAFGRSHDLLLYRRASGFAVFPVRLAGERALETIDIGSVAAATLLVFAIAFLRRSYMRALVAVTLVFASVATAEVLKHGLPHLTRALPPGREATWPSGHTSVAVSLGLALVLAVPPLLRPVAAVLGAAYGAGIGLAVVVLGWHYPSDAVGSFFICGFWASVAAVTLRAGRRPTIDVRGLTLALVVVGIGLFAAAAIAGAHPGAVEATRSSRSVVAVAAVLGVLSVALFAVFTPLVSERRG
ncbi:MAG TPA: phosphatase PAP2 family protein [Gaiellaceae bacterium]|nr:phosphatase PAP2 family protein [Gaiellaceae bacterium]